MDDCNRPWDVLFIGGASGVGKTTIGYHLARQYAVSLTLGDDLYCFAERISRAAPQPIIHSWKAHPEVNSWLAEDILELHLSMCRLMAPAFQTVATNHIKHRRPVILEGAHILPEVARPNPYEGLTGGQRVRGIFLYEPDEQQIVRNLLARMPHRGEQTRRAHVSWLFGEWLRQECERYGVPALPSRPWHNLLDRITESCA